MDLNQAIAKHAEWKLKFRAAITKQQIMDVATISRDDCCDLGKWIHNEGKAKFSGLASHAACLAAHRTFHAEAGKVAAAINGKQYQDAEKMLGSGTPYANASSNVGAAIVTLKKEAGL